MKRPSPKLRIVGFALWLAFCINATGCDKLKQGNDSPTSPSGPPAAGSIINYAAIGASDAIGIGSSVVCFVDCPNGTGYVFVTERALRTQGFTVNLTLLALPTATLGPDFQLLGLQYNHQVLGNLIAFGPFVPRDATLVTIFAGGNDVEVIMAALGGGAGANNQAAFIDNEVVAFGADYATLLGDIRSRAGSARIVAINLPNFAGIPLYAGAALSTRQAAQRASVGMTATVINALVAQNVLVVDLMCDPRFYQSSNFSSDGFHPNDVGYAMLSNLVVLAATSPSYPNPPSSCPQMALVP